MATWSLAIAIEIWYWCQLCNISTCMLVVPTLVFCYFCLLIMKGLPHKPLYGGDLPDNNSSEIHFNHSYVTLIKIVIAMHGRFQSRDRLQKIKRPKDETVHFRLDVPR